jgi:uncharacterized integral membrane protein (TIGR00698 family)
MSTATPTPPLSSSFREQTLKSLPGLMLLVALGLLSAQLGRRLPQVGDVTIAIIVGVCVGNLLPQISIWNMGAVFAERYILPISIALLGVELQLSLLLQSGLLTLVVIVVSITTSLLVSLQLGAWMGYSRKFSLLVGMGNGICGSSAIAASSNVIHAEQKDIGISISVINLLGTLGIFLLPALIGAFKLTETQAGLLIGGSLQAVGQVVAAGFTVGGTTPVVATAVKMGRVLMLGPMVILLGARANRRQPDATQKNKVQIPLFIVAFFGLSVLASLAILPPSSITFIKSSGRLLLVIAMIGIGMRIQLQALLRSGLGALLFGFMVWASQIAVLLLLLTLWP